MYMYIPYNYAQSAQNGLQSVLNILYFYSDFYFIFTYPNPHSPFGMGVGSWKGAPSPCTFPLFPSMSASLGPHCGLSVSCGCTVKPRLSELRLSQHFALVLACMHTLTSNFDYLKFQLSECFLPDPIYI